MPPAAVTPRLITSASSRKPNFAIVQVAGRIADADNRPACNRLGIKTHGGEHAAMTQADLIVSGKPLITAKRSWTHDDRSV